MFVKMIIGLAVGALAGGLIGATRTCSTGGCPLTATPKRAALWGSLLGLLLALSLPSGGTVTDRSGTNGTTLAQQTTPVIRELKTMEDFQREALAREGKSLVVFEAAWCGACRAYEPIVQKTAQRFSGQVAVFHVDVDAAKDLARNFQIEMLPTTIIVQNGKIQHGFIGVASEEKLAAILEGSGQTHPPAYAGQN